MAMTSSYDPAIYDSLPSLAQAGRRFDEKDGENLVDDTFRNLFLQHRMESTFGLVLLHRHFDLSPKEQLVEYRGTSVPWEVTPLSRSSRVQPSNWALAKDGSFHPYEFHYSTDNSTDSDDNSPENPDLHQFMQSFQDVLHERDLVNVFGLARYPGDDFEGTVEITEGRANINLHPNDAPSDLRSRTATWFFSPILYNKCTCICGLRMDDSHSGHRGHVTTR